ncbi:MAG: TIM barrel protein, partial [Planctomycetota bacterium]|nr:TIM barrel protein [Planctomycetota bacterium]
MNPLKFRVCLIAVLSAHGVAFAQDPPAKQSNLAREQLVAWCIVPFDGKQRGPAARAEMLKRIGMRRVAYDWRQKDVPTFEQEILEYKKHGLEYFAFWSVHEQAFQLFEKHKLHPQVWQIMSSPDAKTEQARVEAAAKQILPLVERTRKLGSKLGLYNHGGWSGQPENMVAVCRYLREHHKANHVGIVYNLHHAHDRIDDFAAVVKLLKPYLLCLNLNGMTANGDKVGRKILPLGEGEHDVRLLKIIRESGYAGPIGIIGHTQDDVEQRLLDNLEGLDWIRPQLDGKPAGPKPKLRTWSNAVAPKPAVKVSGLLLDGEPGYRQPPITVECQATLPSKASYNILVASDTKASGAHWEIFSMNRSGMFTAYLPGMQPDHVNSKAMIVDGKPHTLGMTLETHRIRLFVDGKQVAEQAVKSTGKAAVPGGLGIGRLVNGGLGCSGPIDWVRISRGVRDLTVDIDLVKDSSTLLLWNRAEEEISRTGTPARPAVGGVSATGKSARPTFSPELVNRLLAESNEHGDVHRGLLVFSSAKSACLSCHKLGQHGGTIGPDLMTLITQRKPAELIEYVIWPKRKVEPKYTAHLVLTDRGLSHQGYIVSKDTQQLVLRDPAKGPSGDKTIKLVDIEFQREVGTLMPDNLLASMTEQQSLDLFRFLTTLGRDAGVKPEDMDSILTHAHSHLHGPAKFAYDRKPLHPEHWPSWQHHVNRDRVYDFYAKQADHFRAMTHPPALLEEFPGLDGGKLGHWGNQNEETWASGAWNKTKLPRVQCGTFRGAGVTVPRGICVRLGENNEMSVCFNPDTLTYDALWTGGFVKFSSVRHGFLSGLLMDGKPVNPRQKQPARNRDEFMGMVQAPDHVWFVFRQAVGGKEFIVSESPRVKNGRFHVERREELVSTAGDHPPLEWFALKASKSDAAITKRSAVPFETAIIHGSGSPYAIDTIQLPFDNPEKSLMFASGLAFAADGSAFVCTMQGEVWQARGIEYPSKTATWQRFAVGLHQPLGMHIDEDGIFVVGRDRITKLRDEDGDGFAEVHETVNDSYQTSTGGHDFICGLIRDKSGCFQTVSGNQGLLELCDRTTVLATGFRNADGIGLLPDGTITVPCSEGSWTPASMICAVRPGRKQADGRPPFFGYQGPAAHNGHG